MLGIGYAKIGNLLATLGFIQLQTKHMRLITGVLHTVCIVKQGEFIPLRN